MQDNPRRGILLMVATTIIFSIQDGISRYLAGSYDIITIVAIRYWFFAIFVGAFSAQMRWIQTSRRYRQPWLQADRSVLLVANMRGCIWLAKLVWFNFMLFLLAIL